MQTSKRSFKASQPRIANKVRWTRLEYKNEGKSNLIQKKDFIVIKMVGKMSVLTFKNYVCEIYQDKYKILRVFKGPTLR